MRILALGGAGAVCRYATRDLTGSSQVDEIAIGECNVPAAEKLAAEIGDPRLRVLPLNADDFDSLVKTFRRFDVILNGLPWQYDLAVTQACIEAGVNGLDLSSEEDQWSYDAAARQKGIIFVTGVGATPGITNLMARRGAEQLEQVDEIEIAFAAFRGPAPAPGLLTTLLWEFHPRTEERLYYRDGQYHWVAPFTGARQVLFPGPIGEQLVYYIPHPETRTLPRSLGAKAVAVRGCFPPHVMRLVQVMLETGLYREEPITLWGHQASPLEVMRELLLQLPEGKQTPLWAYGLRVEVIGKVHGQALKLTYWNRHPPQEEWEGPAAYYKNISFPLSIGAQMIARGDVLTRGVVPPEMAFDPISFFAELAQRRIEIREQVEPLESA